jgi:hypothetical protein
VEAEVGEEEGRGQGAGGLLELAAGELWPMTVFRFSLGAASQDLHCIWGRHA